MPTTPVPAAGIEVQDVTARLEPGESVDRGRAARRETPRSAHGDWTPDPHRADPVDILTEQAATRIPELVPIRYGRMMASPFAFFRGAAAVMAADLAATPISGISVQACGDAHIANFGGFAAPDRKLVFGPNDFDETLPAAWEWDVKRMGASVEIAARDIGLSAGRRSYLVSECAREYREGMRGFASESHLNVWYDRLTATELVDRFGGRLGKQGRIRFSRHFARAPRKDSLRAVRKLTETVGGQVRFRNVPPLLTPFRHLQRTGGPQEPDEYVREVIAEYADSLDQDRRYLFSNYRFVDMARKVVGIGSVGTRAWIFLLVGRGGADPLVLQAKEAQTSVLEPYFGASEFVNHGERVVRGQRLSHAATDIFLSWQRSMGLDGKEHDFYVRQLWDWKASMDLSTLSETGLHSYTGACGWSLARAHARSGDRLAIAAYLGRKPAFDRAIARFARAYADQTELDHQRLVEAVAEGRLPARPGV